MRGVFVSLLFLAAVARADTYRVTSGLDDGRPGTFRWAIQSANDHAGPDDIDFDVTTIRPTSQLPPISGDVALNFGDGHGTPPLYVEIDGSLAGDATGLVVDGGGVNVDKIVVNRFARNGIEIHASGVFLTDCRIGTTSDGSQAAPNGGDALLIAGDANRVYYSLFCASQTGIRIRGRNNIVLENRVGLGRNLEHLGNRGDGVVIERGATANIIGRFLDWCILCGYRPSTNFIGANDGNGIVVAGDANSVANNAVGGGYFTDPPFANGANGIVVDGRDNSIAGGEFAFNRDNGLVIRRGSHTVVQNARGTCNGALFIDIDGDGPTPNDPGDFDGVPNRPELIAAVSDIEATTIDGMVDAKPDTVYTLFLFGTGSNCSRADSSSYAVVTDANGHAAFRVNLSSAVASVTAYLIDSAGMPSEASELPAEQRGGATADLSAMVATDRSVAMVGSIIGVTITIRNNGPATVPAAWPADNFFDMPATTEPVGSDVPPCDPECALAAGESATWTYWRRIRAGGTLHLTARAKTVDAYTDPNRDNDTATADVTVVVARHRPVTP